MRRYENPKKYDAHIDEIKVKCSCNHTIVMPVYADFLICSHCKKKVLNNTKAHFRYKMRKEMLKHKEK